MHYVPSQHWLMFLQNTQQNLIHVILRRLPLTKISLSDYVSNSILPSFEVTLTPNEQNANLIISKVLSLVQPSCDVVKGLSNTDVIYEDNSDGTTIVRPSDGPECFLSSLHPFRFHTVSQICSLIFFPSISNNFEPN